MNTFERPLGRRLDQVRECFGELHDADALLRPTERGARKRVAASRLYAAARDGMEQAEDLQTLLGESRAARGFYASAVAGAARFALPQARAASSLHPPARHGEGCHIRVERSRAEPDQFFVVVEMPKDTTSAPTSLIVCDSDDRCQRFPLPAARDGIAQIIAEADSELMRLIGDPATKVYLR